MREHDNQYLVGSIFLTLTLVGGLIYFALNYDTQRNAHFASIPIEVNAASFELELDALRKKVAKPYTNAQEYFAVVTALDELNLKAEKLDAVSPRASIQTARGPLKHSRSLDVQTLTHGNTNRMAMVYNLNFENFVSEREAYAQTNAQRKSVNGYFKWNHGSLLLYLLVWHFIGAGLLGLHFEHRLKEQKCSLFPELLTGKFLLAMLFWEVAFWFYPKTSPEAQWRSIRKAASYMFGTIVSVTGCAMKAVAQTATPTPTPTATSSRKTGCTPTLTGNTQLFSSYVGIDGVVFSPDPVLQQSITIGCGKYYLSLIGSRSLVSTNGAPNFGNEVDLIAGTTRNVGKVVVDFNVGYIAGSELSKNRDDVLKTGLSFTGPAFKIGHTDLKPTAGADFFFPLHKSAMTGGVLASIALITETRIAGRVTASLTPRVVLDDGAFGFQSTVVGVVNGGLNIKINDHFTLQPVNLPFSAPLKHTTDLRQKQWVVGSSLSFSF
jgi:hypothetical protein